MASLGKKLLSAFIEVDDSEDHHEKKETQTATAFQTPMPAATTVAAEADNKFSEHFNRLFADARKAGPGYYEFTKMTGAMQVIADEKARYCAAFAGLQVQGVDKQKLLSSAHEYLQILDADNESFRATIDETVAEKIQARKQEVLHTQQRIQQLSQEIIKLQELLTTVNSEIAENEAKIETSTNGYAAALTASKNHLLQDIDKISQYL